MYVGLLLYALFVVRQSLPRTYATINTAGKTAAWRGVIYRTTFKAGVFIHRPKNDCADPAWSLLSGLLYRVGYVRTAAHDNILNAYLALERRRVFSQERGGLKYPKRVPDRLCVVSSIQCDI